MFMMRILQISDLVTRCKLCEAHHEWRSEEEQEVAESLQPSAGWQDECLEQSSRLVCYVVKINYKLTVAMS